jgi:RHS repeat-associated protein
MIVGPAGFEQIAHASTQYSELGTSSWGTHNRIIEYGEWDGTSGRTGNFTPGYDANGSVTKKITWNTHSTTTDPIDHTKIEEVTYEYNLQNRLKKVTTLPYDESGNPLTAQQSVVKYIYNTDGVLVQKTKDPDGSAVTTIYLVDSYNHTGYAQTLEEMTFNALDPDPVNDIPASRKTYTIGDDMLTEATAEYDYDTSEWTYYAAQLMYDGHGSTRQLVTGSVPNTTIVDDFSYDGYGVLLQDEGNFPPVGTQTSGKVAQQATNLLYAGEHFDTDSQNYYLRARWYDSLSGRFNRMDPFPGSPQDPQSLHKYIYCHANPINATDPSGNSFILNITVSTIIRGAIAALVFGTISTISAKIRGATWGQALWAGVKTAGITGFAFVSPLLAWSLLAIAPVIIGLGIYSGDITGEDVPEIVAYIAAGIALMLLFKSPRFKAWEVKTALKVKIPKAINNLKNLNSVKPARNSKWERAVNTNNKSAQGTLFHAELADLMRAEGMTNVGIEVSYDAAGNIVTYGTKGSIRLDYAIYHKGQIIKVIDLKPTEVINGNWLNKAGQYLNLSAEDFEALSYGGKL